MLKFGRFKTSFNVYSGKKKKSGRHDDIGSTVTINGAYRTNRDEFFVYGNNTEPQRKSTPSRPPPAIPDQPPVRPMRQNKSTSDLTKYQNLPPALREAQSGVSLNPRGPEQEKRHSRIPVDPNKNRKLDAERRVEKQRLEEQKKLEKQRLEEQKKIEKQLLEEQKREKLILQERAKQEKLRQERERKEAAQQAKRDKKAKRAAPQRPLTNPLAQSSSQPASNPGPANHPVPEPRKQKTVQYSTNTLESSISKSSGPPPYAETSNGQNNGESDVIYSQPEDTGSWDLISKHRHNVITRVRNTTPDTKQKVTTLDLNFTLGEDNNNKSNSEV